MTRKKVVATWRLFDLLFSLVVFNEALSIARALKRGPHHPRSEQAKIKRADPHLTYEEHSMAEDLEQMGLEMNTDQMSPEDLTFYYFKLHDNDNNNALDGLEMLKAAMHQNQDQHQHQHQHSSEQDLDESLDDTASRNPDITQPRQNEMLDHIIEVIDEFLLIADANKDGLLHYPEYVKAVTGTFT